jgi:AbrB family looped-hinge helix DNA binding protein
MVVSQARLTSRFQITIPTAVRRALGLEAGDTIYLAVDGDQVVLRTAPGGWTEASRGRGADLWRRVGGAAAIEAERDGWDQA